MIRKLKLILQLPRRLMLLSFAFPIVLVIRFIRPWLLVRWGTLASPRIGHFAANTELYLCERDAGINVPDRRYVDIFSLEPPICNLQLAKMWGRILRIWPVWWILPSIHLVNKMIPGGGANLIGDNTQHDRDVHNLLDRFPPHLQFTPEEMSLGAAGLRKLGIPDGTPFVCLIVRDSAYLDGYQSKDWSYHNYRDSDIQNYVTAAEELANRGYFVIRMGVKVREPLISKNPKIIDYAANGMRTDFLDVYLGAMCSFCISTSTGFDALPLIFRRPIVLVNVMPLGYFFTYRSELISITKHHISVKEGRELTLREIFLRNVGFSLKTSDFQENGIELIENTPEEIRDVVVEMAERLSGTWKPAVDDDALQTRFWNIFPVDAKDVYQNRPIHGEIRARYGAQILRDNRNFLT